MLNATKITCMQNTFKMFKIDNQGLLTKVSDSKYLQNSQNKHFAWQDYFFLYFRFVSKLVKILIRTRKNSGISFFVLLVLLHLRTFKIICRNVWIKECTLPIFTIFIHFAAQFCLVQQLLSSVTLQRAAKAATQARRRCLTVFLSVDVAASLVWHKKSTKSHVTIQIILAKILFFCKTCSVTTWSKHWR